MTNFWRYNLGVSVGLLLGNVAGDARHGVTFLDAMPNALVAASSWFLVTSVASLLIRRRERAE